MFGPKPYARRGGPDASVEDLAWLLRFSGNDRTTLPLLTRGRLVTLGLLERRPDGRYELSAEGRRALHLPPPGSAR